MNAADHFAVALRGFIAGQSPGRPFPEAVATRRLRAIVRHASEHVPLYRDLYRSRGVKIDAIAEPQDLWKLPAVSKADYVRAGPTGYTDRGGELLNPYTQRTSGSVGVALTIYATQEEALQLLAALWTGWLGMGVTAQDRLFMMSAPYLSERVHPFRTVFIPVRMKTDEIVNRFQNFRPTVIIGMVESIALLAAELKRRDVPERADVRVIFPFGQTFSKAIREMVTSCFDAEVFELYGSAEAGWLGYECEQHHGLHVPEDRVVVQISRTGEPGQPASPNELGEVIVTSLLRGTTPFIRYRLHDAAALEVASCPCGRSGPRIVQIEGRIQDFLVASDGHWVGPGAMAIDLVVGRPAIVDHRIVQQDRHHVKVSIVLHPDLPPVSATVVREIVRRHLGPVQVEVECVDEIPRDPSGKRRRVYRMFDLPAD
jgi:phenylacetate-coenzyme A ligase PaaK-like adenylate-forming protein